jgi:hypothetical protein
MISNGTYGIRSTFQHSTMNTLLRALDSALWWWKDRVQIAMSITLFNTRSHYTLLIDAKIMDIWWRSLDRWSSKGTERHLGVIIARIPVCSIVTESSQTVHSQLTTSAGSTLRTPMKMIGGGPQRAMPWANTCLLLEGITLETTKVASRPSAIIRLSSCST